MAGGTVPSQSNLKLFNGGSEWQNDFGNLPDYYGTLFRNYDPAMGRFTSVDIRAVERASMSPYQYGANNPVFFSDPMGDKQFPLREALLNLRNSPHGGTWYASDGSLGFF